MKDFFKKWIINRWQYKAAAFIMAFFLWFYVVSEQSLNLSASIPIEFTNFPADMQVINKIKTSADITLEGRRDIVRGLDKKQIKALLDLKKSRPGKNDYTISAAQIKGVPRGLLIRSISPTSITIEFEKILKETPAPQATPEEKKIPEAKKDTNGKTLR